MSDVAVEIVDDPARVCAERLAAQAREGGSIVLTGGSTPKRAYEIAAELEPDWSRVDVWWGDERCVPPDDERSNYGMAKRTLLDRLDAQPAAVHRMRGELGRDEGAVAAVMPWLYAATLQPSLGGSGGTRARTPSSATSKSYRTRCSRPARSAPSIASAARR